MKHYKNTWYWTHNSKMSKTFLYKVLNRWGLPSEIYKYIVYEYIYKPLPFLDEFQKLNSYFKYFFEYHSIELFTQWCSRMTADLKYEMYNNPIHKECSLKLFRNYYHDINESCVNILSTFSINPKKGNIEYCKYPKIDYIIAHSDYTNFPYIRDHVIPFVFDSIKSNKDKTILNELFDLFVIKRSQFISQKDYMEELLYVEDMTDMILMENRKMSLVEIESDIIEKLDMILKL
jgi:hypothetical protein